MKVPELDKKFDGGGSIARQLDLNKFQQPEFEQKRVNADFLGGSKEFNIIDQ